MAPPISTTCLIISDTHGEKLRNDVDTAVDVAIHCGDLTEESNWDAFKTALDSLRTQVKAPLKLVIAGNHDWTLDTPIFKTKIAGMNPSKQDLAQVEQVYGRFGQVKEMFAVAETDGIYLLDEGVHHFDLTNGASLTVYASPYTASVNDWGFQYHPDDDHVWAIDETVNVAITHSPPRGILDYTESKQRAGSSRLFAAIAIAKPQIHCFGHTHESWGARMITWRDEIGENPSHFAAIDNPGSTTIENLAKLLPHHLDDADETIEKAKRREAYDDQGYVAANFTAVPGRQTLFVNAAIEGSDEGQQQWPWLAQLALPAINNTQELR